MEFSDKKTSLNTRNLHCKQCRKRLPNIREKWSNSMSIPSTLLKCWQFKKKIYHFFIEKSYNYIWYKIYLYKVSEMISYYEKFIMCTKLQICLTFSKSSHHSQTHLLAKMAACGCRRCYGRARCMYEIEREKWNVNSRNFDKWLINHP